MKDKTLTVEDSSWKFVKWLYSQVIFRARGDGDGEVSSAPKNLFWLGRLAPEVSVINSPLGRRAEKLDPCAIGIRLRPSGPGPWKFNANVKFRCWDLNDEKNYQKSPLVMASFQCEVPVDGAPIIRGTERLTERLKELDLGGRSAELRVELESWRDESELIVSLVNTSPDPERKSRIDAHLYEAVLEVSGIQTKDFQLESLPDSFRYDRAIPAIGINCGVEMRGDSFTTTDAVSVDKSRPSFWNHESDPPNLSFEKLSENPLPQIRMLIDALTDWGEMHWNGIGVGDESADWSAEMHKEAESARQKFSREVERLELGYNSLLADQNLLQAFKIASASIKHASGGKYTSWRPFQIGFLVSALPGIVDPADSDTVDTVWFATGGGKTETYLGLLVTSVIYDRLTGKKTGISAWTRFPLRMLSLQQTQRFADALAGAEIERKRHGIGGAPISLGFFVGKGGTPNKIPHKDPGPGDPNPVDRSMPKKFQVLLRCPFCRNENLSMQFNRAKWTLEHACGAPNCQWGTGRALPFYVVDQEIYRFLPTVIVGTLDKAALVAWQTAMRGFFGPPAGICSRPGHGYCYTGRSSNPHGCLVPGCKATADPVPMEASKWAPRLRLQDELHLLRDSLGAVDSHYESLLDHLQQLLSGTKAKIVGSSATLSGFERQIDILYRRSARVFPQPGPSLESSFWSQPSGAPARRYVALAPRGVTLEFVSDRVLETLQDCVRALVKDPEKVALQLEIPPEHAQHLIDQYGVDLVYGNTVRDVEAARRSAETEFPYSVNAETLTGSTPFSSVRETLERLDAPEDEFESRIHLVAASSMISHGVDVDRFNIMVMKGLPLTTAEFIQTSARVGRRWPGIVFVLHRITREREVATYAQFNKFITQGDRFIEPIPITRASRRVLSLTVAGAVEARRLAIHEYSAKSSLASVQQLRKYVKTGSISIEEETEALVDAFGMGGPMDQLLRQDIAEWINTYFEKLQDPAVSVLWPNELSPSGKPMTSLRDVEKGIPIHGED